MNRYHFDQLSAPEQRYYEKVLHALQQRQNSISPGLMIYVESFKRVLQAISLDHPELYHVDFMHMHYLMTPMGIVFTPSYLYKAGAQGPVDAQINAAADSILRDARAAGMKTPYEYLRWFHNYFVRNVTYNYEALQQPDLHPDAYNCVGVLIGRHAVCEGISKAFKLLCDRAGLDVLIVTGDSCLPNTDQRMPHSWNCAIIDQQYTHIDVTWDINMSASIKATRYDYFCLPDQDMRADHAYEGGPDCRSTRLSYFSQTQKQFSGVAPLKEYLTRELSKNCRVLYFKILPGPSAPGDLHERVEALVHKMIGQHRTGAYSFLMAHNPAHGIFYYKFD